MLVIPAEYQLEAKNLPIHQSNTSRSWILGYGLMQVKLNFGMHPQACVQSIYMQRHPHSLQHHYSLQKGGGKRNKPDPGQDQDTETQIIASPLAHTLVVVYHAPCIRPLETDYVLQTFQSGMANLRLGRSTMRYLFNLFVNSGCGTQRPLLFASAIVKCFQACWECMLWKA